MNDPRVETAKELAEHSRFACWELAKYLFTANTGAAAGMLLLLRSTPGNILVLISFGCFCLGTFCVLLSYFFGASHFVEVALGFQKDLLAGKDDKEIGTRHLERLYGWKNKIIPIGGWLSFVSLIAGGMIAAVAFFNGVIPASEQKTNSTLSILVTNTPTFSLTVTSASPVYFLEPTTNGVHPR